jgi:hypothetical protein
VSIHRRAAKRDENEPDIIKVLRAHGCVVWQLSGDGITDLLVLRKGKKWLADVKMPGKPTTEAQEKKWEEAATKARVAVFILRTPEDATKMLNDALPAWEPERFACPHGKECVHGCTSKHRKGDAALVDGRPHFNGKVTKAQKEAAEVRVESSGRSKGIRKRLGPTVRKEAPHYFPPRSTPVDAAKEAEETFAAPPCGCTREQPCVAHSAQPLYACLKCGAKCFRDCSCD